MKARLRHYKRMDYDDGAIVEDDGAIVEMGFGAFPRRSPRPATI